MKDKKIESMYKILWDFAKAYKLTFFALYLCLIFETILQAITPLLIATIIDEVIYYKNIKFFWIIAACYGVCLIGLSRLSRVIAGLEKYMYIIFAIFIFQIPLTLLSPLFYRMFIDEVLMNHQLHYLYVVIGWNILSFLVILGANTVKLKYENKFYNGMTFNMRIKVFGN